MVWITLRNSEEKDCLIQTDNITKIVPFGGGKSGSKEGVTVYFSAERSLSTYTIRADITAKIEAAEKKERLERLAEQQILVTAFAEALAEKLKEPRRYTTHDKKTPHKNQTNAGNRQ